ncbi:ribbon-helix-helix protein, CopG family [Kinneretia asaccharophila]|uniref:Ribbon-helix-helix CopG family protein n=1 Tax=Roseateles asaccharophilus TaxID=582607 RepID=A0A4R6N3N3_9BURK|nr:ribbon-helix-helix protein, CopG family [Roseateles asaccharophilus]MDN3544040.1 ribbon-helix-helix protein, CopG family [Roseateles asaccharophilus]TDP09365.1 ribbon-helix-helix CopG family protein [Roseateles asaccharophilus]
MSERSRFIKLRVSDAEYKALRQRADAQGVTMSEHVRVAVTAVHKDVDVAAELAGLRQQLRQTAPAAASANSGPSDIEQREILLLLRELAAARDAQILARVRAQLGGRAGVQTQQRGAAA